MDEHERETLEIELCTLVYRDSRRGQTAELLEWIMSDDAGFSSLVLLTHGRRRARDMPAAFARRMDRYRSNDVPCLEDASGELGLGEARDPSDGSEARNEGKGEGVVAAVPRSFGVFSATQSPVFDFSFDAIVIEWSVCRTKGRKAWIRAAARVRPLPKFYVLGLDDRDEVRSVEACADKVQRRLEAVMRDEGVSCRVKRTRRELGRAGAEEGDGDGGVPEDLLD